MNSSKFMLSTGAVVHKDSNDNILLEIAGMYSIGGLQKIMDEAKEWLSNQYPGEEALKSFDKTAFVKEIVGLISDYCDCFKIVYYDVYTHRHSFHDETTGKDYICDLSDFVRGYDKLHEIWKASSFIFLYINSDEEWVDIENWDEEAVNAFVQCSCTGNVVV